MSQSAYIKLVQGSAASSVTVEDIKTSLRHYREQTELTGRQLGWTYAEAAFPYTFESRPGEEDRWFYLKGNHPKYRYILFGTTVSPKRRTRSKRPASRSSCRTEPRTGTRPRRTNTASGSASSFWRK